MRNFHIQKRDFGKAAAATSSSSSKRRVGLIGLPNVGKSTLFNVLTRSSQAEAANVPFCTIEPNMCQVPMIDQRLRMLVEKYQSRKTVAQELQLMDIAGLVPGASEGAGMGNKFLEDVKRARALMQVVRCFDDSEVINTQTTVDPIRDISLINAELVLADLEAIENKKVGSNRRAAPEFVERKKQVLWKTRRFLNEGKLASEVLATFRQDEVLEKEMFLSLPLLSNKPMIYVCNVDEDSVAEGNDKVRAVEEFVGKENVVVVSAKVESEIALLSLEEEMEFLADLGLKSPGLDRVSRKVLDLLDLSIFYSCGADMCTAWLYTTGSSAEKCAEVIHTDLKTNFKSCEIIRPEVLFQHTDEAELKRKKLVSTVGREHVIQDGDILYFQLKQGLKKSQRS